MTDDFSFSLQVILLRRAERKRQREQGVKNVVIDDQDADVRSRRKLAFLDLLLEVHEQDPSFTLEDIREEVDTFMFEVTWSWNNDLDVEE